MYVSQAHLLHKDEQYTFTETNFAVYILPPFSTGATLKQNNLLSWENVFL